MPFAVVLDTCMLYPAHLRHTLLRLAERGLYEALWSADILTELHRNLVEVGIRSDAVDYLRAEMLGAFPKAEVTGYRTVVDSMICDPKDRHVLAAAVVARWYAGAWATQRADLADPVAVGAEGRRLGCLASCVGLRARWSPSARSNPSGKGCQMG